LRVCDAAGTEKNSIKMAAMTGKMMLFLVPEMFLTVFNAFLFWVIMTRRLKSSSTGYNKLNI
jgi:hypothetical protein